MVKVVTDRLLDLKAELKSYLEVSPEPESYLSSSLKPEATIEEAWERLLTVLGLEKVDNTYDAEPVRKRILERALEMANDLRAKIRQAQQDHFCTLVEVLSSSPDEFPELSPDNFLEQFGN